LVTTDDFRKRNVWQDLEPNFSDEDNLNHIEVKDTLSFHVGKIKITILHPDKSYNSINLNNMSIVMRLDYQELSLLFTGDLEVEGEEYLLENYVEHLDVDFLKAGHHGSKTSSSQPFLNAVTPEYAVISTSLHNRFDFPHPQTLNSFSHLKENLFITGKDGAIILNSDGSKIFIQTLLTNKTIQDSSI
jgi:competence protein ComEC